MASPLRISGLVLLLVCGACGGDSKTDASDAATDSHVATDARVDSGRDANVADTGMNIDANFVNDSGNDSGSSDSGSTPMDSGPQDAGFDACVVGGPTGTVADVCMGFCQGGLVTYCSFMPDGGCVEQCTTLHQGLSPVQLGRIVACEQMLTSASACAPFFDCYALAKDCP